MTVCCIGVGYFIKTYPNWHSLSKEQRETLVNEKISQIDAWITSLGKQLQLPEGCGINVFVYPEEKLTKVVDV